MKRSFLALPLSLLVPACGAPDPADLAVDETDRELVQYPMVISEFKAGAAGYVELFNSGGAPADLTGWSVDDIADGGAAPVKLQSIVLAPQQFLLVPFAGINSASKDEVRLLNQLGGLTDEHSNFYAGSSVAGLCFGRRMDSQEWVTAAIPCTPGKSNGLGAADTRVVIDEFKPGSAGWVEIYNRTGAPVDLAGWAVDDVAAAGAAPKKIPSGTVLPAHGVLVVSYGGFNTGSADAVRLLDASGDEVDRHANFYAGASISGKCFGRIPDGGAWSATSIDCSPGTLNGGGALPPACTAPGGAYKTVRFSAAEECQALDFLNHARYSQIAVLGEPYARIAYDCGPTQLTSVASDGSPLYRVGNWSTLAEYAVAKCGGTVTAGVTTFSRLKTESSAWVDDGAHSDTVGGTVARLASDATPGTEAGRVTFEMAWVEGPAKVTKNGRVNTNFPCFMVRDSASAPESLTICPPPCSADFIDEACTYPAAPAAGSYSWVRGTVAYDTFWWNAHDVRWFAKNASWQHPSPALP